MSVSRSHIRVHWAVLLLLTLSAAAVAQDSFPPIDKQLWDVGVWGGEAVGKTRDQGFGGTQISMAGFHVGRVIHRAPTEKDQGKTLEYTVDLQPLFLQTRVQRAYGGGLAPLGVKWSFVPRGRYRAYLEFNGGGMFTQKNVPTGNTSAFNFTLAIGPGVMIALPRNQALSIAVRYWHLSNGGLGYDNPAFNTLQLVVGYHCLSLRHARERQVVSTSGTPQAK